MPVIVDEVVISVEVTGPASGAAAPPPPVDQKRALVSECVEQVLEILSEREER